MAVVMSIACGRDASYPFKTIGAVFTGERGAGHYLSAVDKAASPPAPESATAPPDSASRDLN